MSVVLLFGGGLQALSLSKGLHKNGHRVISLGDSHAVGKYGRWIDNFYEIVLNNIEFSDFKEYCNREKVNVIIPTEDEYAEWLSRYKDKIEADTSIKCAVMPFDIFKNVINKNRLLNFCKENQIPHPLNINIDSSNLSAAADKMSFPALIKPSVSNGARGILLVNDKSEFLKKAPEVISAFGECALQEFIHNETHYYNAMLYRYKDGHWGESVVTKITRFYPIKGGSSSFCTTIKNDRITEICKKLLELLNWEGFADFDILEKGEGDYRIIEINPRVPASLHAALVSGVDFGSIIVADLTEDKTHKTEYRPGEQLRFFGLDIAWFLASPNRFKTNPSWFKFWGRHLHYQEGGIGDFKAMCYSIWTGIKKQLSPSFRKAKAGMN